MSIPASIGQGSKGIKLQAGVRLEDWVKKGNLEFAAPRKTESGNIARDERS